jgi:hypothetical protein
MSCIPVALTIASVALLTVRLAHLRRSRRQQQHMRIIDWYVWHDGQLVPLDQAKPDLRVVDKDGTIRQTKRGNQP